MTDEMKLPPEYDPEKYRLLANGAIYGDAEGRIVANLGGTKYQITPERAREMRDRREIKRVKSEIKGRIDAGRAIGMDLPDPDSLSDDELIEANCDVDRYVAMLYLKAFMTTAENVGSGKGGSFRGLGEGYPKAQSIGGNDQGASPGSQIGAEVAVINSQTAQTLASVWADVMSLHDQQAPQVIEAHFSAHDTKGEGE